MQHFFEGPGGRVWRVYLRARTEGLSTSVNLAPEDLIFSSEGEDRVVRGYGLGTQPLTTLSPAELAKLFARSHPELDDRVHGAPHEEVWFWAACGTRIHVRDMPTYRIFRFENGEERRYTWHANDPRDINVTSLRRQLQESESADER
jgi:hypothetical protein